MDDASSLLATGKAYAAGRASGPLLSRGSANGIRELSDVYVRGRGDSDDGPTTGKRAQGVLIPEFALGSLKVVVVRTSSALVRSRDIAAAEFLKIVFAEDLYHRTRQCAQALDGVRTNPDTVEYPALVLACHRQQCLHGGSSRVTRSLDSVRTEDCEEAALDRVLREARDPESASQVNGQSGLSRCRWSSDDDEHL